jgi:NAD(P)-dependent dehydrogenase (short-subunit alcohol dehydrogenase family)
MKRRVLITGCSSGIGLALAQRFLAQGWQVTACLRDATHAPAELAGCAIVTLDLTDPAQIAAAAADIDELDCLVNNAGYALVGNFSAYSDAQMRRQLDTNLLGPVRLTQALLPALRRRNGRIIVLSSMAGETGLPLNSLYCASKFALEGWAEALHHELAPQGVHIALVEPGGHRTRFAANLDWAGDSNLDATEQQQLAAYKGMLAHRLSQPAPGPAIVADAVMKLAASPQMPLRTRVGADARAVHWLKRLLPERWAQALLARRLRQLLDAHAPERTPP